MELYLDNIGKICDSAIIVDGLTVITGENNSGKTTVGKTLYSIISATEDLRQNAFIDKRSFVMITALRIFNHTELRKFSKIIDKNADIDSIFDINILGEIENIEGIISAIDEKIAKLKNCSEEDVYEFLKKGEEDIARSKRLFDNFIKEREELIKLLDELKKSLQADPELVEYANTKIIKTLKAEFYNQIKGVYNESKESKIKLSHEGEDYYNIKLLDNELSSKDEVFLLPAFDTSLFVEDVLVVDYMINYRGPSRPIDPFLRNEDDVSYGAFLDKVPRRFHRNKLIDKLTKNNNDFEENLYKAKTEGIIKCMKSANPGQIVSVKGKYVIDELDIRNLAMGSKMFLIIKTLIEKGHCGSKTLLVLDEPETHLHTEWQTILAETIVLLVKNLGTKVILTTHNPSFLLAIDFFSKEHEVRDITHFYQSDFFDEGKKVELKLADENINEIYAKMTKPFLELEAMMDGINEDNDLDK
jgi:predicted ATPase